MQLTPQDKITLYVEITSKADLTRKKYKRIVVTRGKPLKLGRSTRTSDIIIHDEAASKSHVEFRVIRDEIWVKDLQTKNGTFVNTHNIVNARLKVGDLISIGDHHIYIRNIKFSLEEEEMTSAFLLAKKMEQTQTELTITNLLKRMVS